MEYNVNELLKRISKLETELKATKKYGLVWDKEDVPEKIVQDCKNNIPVLKQEKDLNIIIKNNHNNNVLIEGDNFHILSALNGVLRESIDVIYIDPPYNTGEKDFKYNDTFVNKDDEYYHSKWLNFMAKRLNLARELLKPNGIILISIDEHEHTNLCLLCDMIFGCKIGEVIRKTKTVTGDSVNSFNLQHEYCIIYSKKNAEVVLNGSEKKFTAYANPDNDPNGPWVSADPSAKSGGKTTYFEIKNPYTGQVDLPPVGRYWAFNKETLKSYIETGRLVFKKVIKPNQRGFRFKRYQNKQKNIYETMNSLDFTTNSFMNQSGTKEAKLFGFANDFKYPKPTAYIKKLLLYCTNKKSIVLDFFAGSGTTGQAILELNKEDNGNRKFILCTNNENNICRNVTYPRLKSVITGKMKDGSIYSNFIPSNLYYFKSYFIKDCKNTDQAKYNLVAKVDSLLCIKEDIFNLVEMKEFYSQYENGEKHLFIYNELYNVEKFNIFKNKVLKTNGKKIVYIFSFDNNICSSLIKSKDVIVKSIPSKIYEIYKEIVETIKRGE